MINVRGRLRPYLERRRIRRRDYFLLERIGSPGRRLSMGELAVLTELCRTSLQRCELLRKVRNEPSQSLSQLWIANGCKRAKLLHALREGTVESTKRRRLEEDSKASSRLKQATRVRTNRRGRHTLLAQKESPAVTGLTLDPPTVRLEVPHEVASSRSIIEQ